MAVEKLILTLLLLSSICWVNAQQPFDCDGTAYLTLVNENDETKCFELNTGNEGFEINSFAPNNPFNINAIGFNQTDSLIYGLDPEIHGIYQIGSDGVIIPLGFLPLVGAYYAGDIHPDGGKLTLFNADSIAIVDLNSIETPILYTPVVSNHDSISTLFVTDIAYHPFTKVLYGYDAIQGKLITIDQETGIVDNSSYPSIGYNSTIPAMFFDARGRLYGIATDNQELKAILFEFDIETGEATRTLVDGEIGDRDACSCPYTLKVYQELSSYEALPCDEVEVTITISNLTNSDLLDHSLEEVFPEDFIITEVLSESLQLDFNFSVGTNRLSAQNINIPHGIHEIKFLLQVPDSAKDNYEMQAILTTPSKDILSDDVKLPMKNEKSVLQIENFISLFSSSLPDTLELCEGDSVFVNIPFSSELEYVWSDGDNSTNRIFEEAGIYTLKIGNNCDSILLTTTVIETPFALDLGNDIEINYGGVTELSGEINSISPVISYQWFNSDIDIPCLNCPSIQINPVQDSEYFLIIENEAGCSTSDNIRISIKRQVFSPNVFSPNGDGFNDYFYLQSGNPGIKVNFLKIFDRWGSMVFNAKESVTNNEADGWNGKIKGERAHAGLYYWIAELEFPDGKKVPSEGEFAIMN